MEDEDEIAVTSLTDDHVQQLSKWWRFEGWINAWPLSRTTVLDYFKHSPFYDRSCNNEVIFMQNKDPTQLKHQKGIEYEVATEPEAALRRHDRTGTENWLLIKKNYRLGPKQAKVLAMYYVVGVDPPEANPNAPQRGYVIPVPDIHSVLSTNLVTAAFYIGEAFAEISKHVKFRLEQDYTWDIIDKEKEKRAPPRAHEHSDLVQECLQMMMTQ